MKTPRTVDEDARLAELEAALAAKEEELRACRAVLTNLPKAAVALFDRDLRFVLVEGKDLMEDIAMDAAQVRGRTVHEVALPANVEVMASQYRRTLEGHVGNFEVIRNGRSISIHTVPIRDASGEVTHGMMTSYDVTSFRATEQALTQQTQLVGLLQAVTFAANCAQDSREAMQVCLDEVCGYLGWPIGHAFRREGDALVSASIWHFADSLWSSAAGAVDMGPFVAATRDCRVTRGVGFVAAVLESGRSLSLGNLEDLGRADSARRAGIKSGLAIPVLVGTEVAAVLEFYTLDDDVPDANSLEVLSNVGTQIGRVIERERAQSFLEAHAAAVRSMSARDELTGLYNRRGFMEQARQQLEVAQRTGAPAVLFFADLNGMKPINDLLGHEEGDRALVDMANVWRNVFRASDVVARLGGDEFVLFAAGVDADAEKVLRARILREVDAFNALGERPYRLSVSIGAALVEPAATRSLEDLLSAADVAMYEQKRSRARAA